MAERASLRNDGRRAAQDNDPFAELARIIGFDPRVRVRGGESGSQNDAAQAEAAVPPEAAGRPSVAPSLVKDAAKPTVDAEDAADWGEAFSNFDVWATEEAAAEGVAPEVAGVGDTAEPPSAAFKDAAEANEEFRAEPTEGEADARASLKKASESTQNAQRVAWDVSPQPPHSAVEGNSSPAKGAKALAADADVDPVSFDFELDDVLAASIERDLEDSWLGEGQSEPDKESEGITASALEMPRAEQVLNANSRTVPVPATENLSAPADASEEAAPDFEGELIAYLAASDSHSSEPAARQSSLVTHPHRADSAGPVGAMKSLSADPQPERSPRDTISQRNEAQDDAAVEVDSRPFLGRDFASEGAAVETAPDPRDDRGMSPPARTAPEPDDDPFAALAAMAARYRAAQFNPTPVPKSSPAPAPTAPPAPQPLVEQQAEAAEMKRLPSARSQAPEIETVDVSEYAVGMTDDVDVPELPYDEPPTTNARFDDVDAEFADLLQEMGGAPARQAERATSRQQTSAYHRLPDARYDAPPRAAYRSDYASRDYPPEPVAAAPAAYGRHAEQEEAWPVENYGNEYSDPYDETVYPAAFADDDEPAPRKQPRKRGRWLAALFGSVAIFGAAGAFALKYTGAAELGGPVLVKADATPIKIRPENPGGVAVPNQENQVYERVAGLNNIPPAQPKLLSSDEQPVSLDDQSDDGDLPGLDLSSEDDDAPVAKGDDRVTASDEQPAQPAKDPIMVSPHKVKTMVVKPDGSLVQAEAASPAVQSLVADASNAIDTVKKGSMTAAVDTSDATASVKPDGDGNGAASAISAESDALPAAQPAVVEASAIPSSWSMQIASQPNEASARSSYANLAQRYAAVLSGHDVKIVKAEVSGKGTFWRVRVAANTRSDAVSLCASYKAAGGTCFVSR